jgi:serine/threonine protein kinase
MRASGTVVGTKWRVDMPSGGSNDVVSGFRLLEPSTLAVPTAWVKAIRDTDGMAVEILVVTAKIDGRTVRRIRADCAHLEASLAEVDPAVVLPLLDHAADADGRPYLVFPRPGPALDEVLAATGPLAVDEVNAAARAAAEGLRALADRGITGPPPRLWRGPHGNVVLGTPLPSALVELDSTLNGSGPHDPPEVLAGGDWTPQGQVYACASMLWTLLSGRPPFGAGADGRLARMIGSEVPVMRRTDVPVELMAVLKAALTLDPAARPADLVVTRHATGEQTLPPFRPVQTGTADGQPLGSRYLLTKRIGQGSTGQVWAGTRRADGQPVAVKLLRSDLAADRKIVDRFVGERTMLLRLDHPNLVRVHDLVVEGEVLGIVMDLVDGPDLRTLSSKIQLSAAEATGLLAQVAGALAAVHAGGVIHRDLKPENVLVTPRGGRLTALLGDFGIARTVDSTTSTQLVGTPAYMAPELVAGTPPTPAVDIYSLGVTAYELLTGHRPFDAPSATEMFAAHRDQPVVRPHGLDDRAWAILAACLAKEPQRRPTAAQCAARWTELAAHVVPNSQPVPPMSPPAVHEPREPSVVALPTVTSERPLLVQPDEAPKPARRRRWPYLAAAGVLLIGAAVGVSWAIIDNPDQPQNPPPPQSLFYPVAATASLESDAATVRWPSEVATLPGLQAYFIFGVNSRGDYIKPLAENLPKSQSSYRITGLRPDQAACFKVLAYGVTAPAPVPPPPPACVTPASKGSDPTAR